MSEENSILNLSLPKRLGLILVVTLAMYLAGRLGLSIPYFHSSISLIWLPTGIGLAALIRFGFQMCLPIFLGSILTNLAQGSNLSISIAIALGSTLALSTSFSILKRMGFQKTFHQRDIILLTLAAAMGMLVSSTMGVASLYLGGELASSGLLNAWKTWWMGDTLGIFQASPFLVIFSKENLKRFLDHWTEALLLLASTIFLGILGPAFHNDGLLVSVSFLIIFWSAMRFGQMGGSTVVLILAIMEAYQHSLAAPNENRLFLLWAYLGIMSMFSLLISALQSENLRVTRALMRSEERLKIFIDQNPFPISMVDINMIYLAASKKWIKDLVRGDPKIIGKSHYEVFPEIPERWKIIHRRCLGGVSEKADEDSFIRTNGEIAYNRWEINPWFDADGKVGGIFMFSEDITEKKTHEKHLQEMQLKLIQSSKMASLGEISAGIAHEINNPLTIINSSLRWLPSCLNDAEKLTNRIETIQRACDRITRIVQGLKKYSRSDGKVLLKPHCLCDIVKDVNTLTAATLKNLDVLLSFDCEKCPTIECDEVQIEQVLINLENNAFFAASKQTEKWVKLSVEEEGNFVVFRIMDSGPGIPEASRDKIFNPFFTTKDIGEGTGLGLSISKGILADHRATIKLVVDCPNTCFEIKFPKIS